MVYSDGQVAYRHSEYRLAATWAQRAYNLTDDELMAIFREYKDDYDLRKDQ